jgi:hypothetical protein
VILLVGEKSQFAAFTSRKAISADQEIAENSRFLKLARVMQCLGRGQEWS